VAGGAREPRVCQTRKERIDAREKTNEYLRSTTFLGCVLLVYLKW